jgi:chromosome partitioning protein
MRGKEAYRSMTMTTVAIANHKGGVGKTSTTLHLGGALAHLGYTVLLWDLDPMGGLTTLLQKPDGPNPFTDAPALVETAMEGVRLVPGGPALKSAEPWLAHRPHTALRSLLEALAPEADFVLIDCPPQLDDLTKNALVAADAAILPVSCDTQDLLSFHKLLLTAEELSARYPIAPALVALLTKYHGEAYDEEFRETLREAAPLLFGRPVRYSTAFRQAGLYGASVFAYEPGDSPAREDYLDVARDVLDLVSAGGSNPHMRGEAALTPDAHIRSRPPSPNSGRGHLGVHHVGNGAIASEIEGQISQTIASRLPLPELGEGPAEGQGEGHPLPMENESGREERPNPKSKIQNPKSGGVEDVAA